LFHFSQVLYPKKHNLSRRIWDFFNILTFSLRYDDSTTAGLDLHPATMAPEKHGRRDRKTHRFGCPRQSTEYGLPPTFCNDQKASAANRNTKSTERFGR
jgi:hypothetical protein